MPVIINELVVKGTVAPPEPGKTVSEKETRDKETKKQRELIEECVDQVLKILEQRAER